MTAGTFKNALLIELLLASREVAGANVNAESLYKPVLDRMGAVINTQGDTVTINKHTLAMASVLALIQGAFRNLRNLNLGVKVGRGRWALTAEGVIEARKILGVPASAVQVAVTTPPVTKVEDKIVYADNSDSKYHPDSYIRELGILNQPCAGLWASNATTCAQCTLSRECLQIQYKRLDAAAAILAEAAEAPIGSPPPAAPPSAGPLSPAKDRRLALPANLSKTSIVCRTDVQCTHCKSKIKKGTRIYWVENGGHAGMYHVECVTWE